MRKEKNKGVGHRKRLRGKLIRAGIESLNDYEIIELLLTLGTPRKDCKDIAKELINEFENIHNIIYAEDEELLKFKGIGEHNIFGIKLARGIIETFHKSKLMKKNRIRSAKDLVDYLYSSMGYLDREVFKTVFLNVKNEILKIDDLFVGTVNESPVYPREIMRKAFLYNATSIIIVHNHPSGDVSPSKGDILVTEKIKDICNTMDISLLDHIIIGKDKYYSFAEEGII
ncbi:MAG: DNA repair protein RadC [Proteobacteria bacterium]|nr:DNA repair protein RadC [Pseudomonadota bacterium]